MTRIHDLLTRLLPRGRFTRGVVMLAGGTALGQAIILAVSPLLTRLYTPEDLGSLGLFLSFVGVASVALSLRYEAAIVSCRDSREAAYLVLGSCALAVPMSLISSGVFYFLVDRALLGFGSFPGHTVLIVLAALLPMAVFGALKYWFIREGAFGTISRVMVWQNSVRALSQVGFGLAGVGWLGLVVGDVLGRVAGTGSMVRAAWRSTVVNLTPFKFGLLPRLLATYRKFAIYSFPSSLIDTLSLNLPVPLISSLYGIKAAGYFSLVQRVLGLPASLVGGSVADSFHGRIAAYAREEPRKSYSFFLRTAGGLLALGLAPTVLLMVVGGRLFGWVFGAQWVLAGHLAAGMAPWALSQLVVSPVSRVVFVFSGQELKLVYDVLSLGTTVGVLFLTFKLGYSLVPAIELLSLSRVLTYVVYFALLMRMVAREQ